MRGLSEMIGRIVGWDETYERHHSHVKWEKGETPVAVRTHWGEVTAVYDAAYIPVMSVRDIHDGQDWLIAAFDPHTVMPAAYSA